MSHNTFGHLFRVTTWGESHGPALGCVVDGCPPGLGLTEAEIQPWLDRRRPGTSRFVTQRREPDQVRILSGVFEDERTGGQVTTGTPISLMIENTDQRSKDYSEIRDSYRPGHADYVYDQKYGVRDYRAAAAPPRARPPPVWQPAPLRERSCRDFQRARCADRGSARSRSTARRWDWNEVDQNPFFSPGRRDGGEVGAVSRRHPQGTARRSAR